jgi:hypothetical protein
LRPDGQLGYHLMLCLLRGLAVPCPRPRAHRRAIQYLDRDGNGFFLCSLILSKVRPWYSLAHPSANTGIGANGRCSWPETNMKKLRSSLVRFRTATMCGASSVNSRSTLVVPSTRAMVHGNKRSNEDSMVSIDRELYLRSCHPHVPEQQIVSFKILWIIAYCSANEGKFPELARVRSSKEANCSSISANGPLTESMVASLCWSIYDLWAHVRYSLY